MRGDGRGFLSATGKYRVKGQVTVTAESEDCTFSPLGPADPTGPTGPGAPCEDRGQSVGDRQTVTCAVMKMDKQVWTDLRLVDLFQTSQEFHCSWLLLPWLRRSLLYPRILSHRSLPETSGDNRSGCCLVTVLIIGTCL